MSVPISGAEKWWPLRFSKRSSARQAPGQHDEPQASSVIPAQRYCPPSPSIKKPQQLYALDALPNTRAPRCGLDPSKRAYFPGLERLT